MDWLFEFEQDRIPPAVLLATGALIAIFALGIPYRLLVSLF
ncbi:hypothetical protein [Salinadaptatus halalkaliphilus]|nr:hypothetical protein [Salinadaptatus halalkaliphilus]